MTSAIPPRLIALTRTDSLTQRGFSTANWPTSTECSSPPLLTTIMDDDHDDQFVSGDLPPETFDANHHSNDQSPISQTSPVSLADHSEGETAAVGTSSSVSNVSRKKKSKRRRWVLSRRPKCFSRTNRVVYPPPPPPPSSSSSASAKRQQKSTKTAIKREIAVTDNGLWSGETTGHGMSVLESAVHASVFLPHKCQENGENGAVAMATVPSTTMTTTTTMPMTTTTTTTTTTNDCRRHLDTMRLLLPHLRPITKSKSNYDVQAWSVDDVAKFVKVCCPAGPEKLAERFKDELIDGEALLLLKFDDFYKQMNIKLGPSLKIYWSVDYLKHLRSIKTTGTRC